MSALALVWMASAWAGSDRAPSTWTLTSENDSPWSLMWGRPYRDEYYTNGVRLSRSQWVSGHTDRGLGRAADRVAGALHLGTADVVHFSVSQTMYTPVEIWERTVPASVHPYAGHLFVTAGLGATRDGLRTSVEVLGGWTGPPALGEPAQKKVHELFNGYEPMGWDHQVAFEPTGGVTLSLSAVELARDATGPVEVRLVPTVLAVAASTDLAAEVGGLVGLGTRGDVPAVRPEEARFGHRALGTRTRGPTPVGGALYAYLDARMTAHDMFVEGGTLHSVPAPEAEGALTEGGVGGTLRLWGTRVTMATNVQTHVYDGQERNHVYGTIAVSQDLGGAD